MAVTVIKQCKTNWCWATSALKAIVAKKPTWAVPSNYTPTNSPVGLRTGITKVDIPQEYIVRTYSSKTLDEDPKVMDNVTGSTADMADAITGATGISTDSYGTYTERPFAATAERKKYIDDHLSVSAPVLGNAYSDAGKGHTIVILSKSGDVYKYWDSWTAGESTATGDALFKTGFKSTAIAGMPLLYVENVLYFN